MILWINGAFGSGKTQTANELHCRLAHSFLYDPENVGYWLRKNEPKQMQKSNFQDEPLWRSVNRDMLLAIARQFDGTIIVPMTLINKGYYDEIIGALRREGVDVRHFVLGAGEETIRKRLQKRGEGKHSWAAAQIPACLAALDSGDFENCIDTEALTVAQVAEEIANLLALPLLPRKGRLQQAAQRVLTQLRAIHR